jgi:hypothetical protein
MGKQGCLRFIFLWVLFFGLLLPPVVTGQTAPETEKKKIETLIRQVGELQDAKFIRNGSSYEVATAIRFLRGKWQANDAQVKTARDFIEKVASASGTSGKPYLIRFKDGREVRSHDFLLVELKKIETTL